MFGYKSNNKIRYFLKKKLFIVKTNNFTHFPYPLTNRNKIKIIIIIS